MKRFSLAKLLFSFRNGSSFASKTVNLFAHFQHISFIIFPNDMISLEDFFRNATSSSFRLSPDGRHLAYLAPYRDRMNLFVRSIAPHFDSPARPNAVSAAIFGPTTTV